MTAVRTRSLLDAVTQDGRYAIRLLARTPGFTIVAVLILALGIGANTSIFSVVSAVLLKPLPFAEADRLVLLWEDAAAGGFGGHGTVAPANYVDWKARSRSFEDMALFNGLQEYNLTGGGDPGHVGAIVATANLFSVLRLTPILGRTFAAGDEGWADRLAIPKNADATPVVVLSRTLWTRRFGADPEIIGRDIELDGVKHTVIGVVPPAFNYPSKKAEIYVPASFAPEFLAQRDNHSMWVVARLKPGVALAQAQAEMGAVAKSLETAPHPRDAADRNRTRARLARARLHVRRYVLHRAAVRRGTRARRGARRLRRCRRAKRRPRTAARRDRPQRTRRRRDRADRDAARGGGAAATQLCPLARCRPRFSPRSLAHRGDGLVAVEVRRRRQPQGFL